jgi:hypothetical protein
VHSPPARATRVPADPAPTGRGVASQLAPAADFPRAQEAVCLTALVAAYRRVLAAVGPMVLVGDYLPAPVGVCHMVLAVVSRPALAAVSRTAPVVGFRMGPTIGVGYREKFKLITLQRPQNAKSAPCIYVLITQ